MIKNSKLDEVFSALDVDLLHKYPMSLAKKEIKLQVHLTHNAAISALYVLGFH